MSDSSEIENAVMAKLLADPTLMALVPDGVHFDIATIPGARRFVIVSLLSETDEQAFLQRSFEDAVVLVKAVMLSAANGDIQAAAARIDVLLDNAPLTIPGYSLMVMARDHRVRYSENDDVDPDLRWDHRGGEYHVVASL